ncbi:RND family efflux transporter MFP subunit [Cupriavidus plantarum]|uniref:RND family efflux transporter MFP subunit n=2 Tax=Cupriavidus plantarum TaxID=942865 RepID=A0A316EY06_9BURK|nr:RND family efflux transporter MFP subunit [Cupriavidus plantarum]
MPAPLVGAVPEPAAAPLIAAPFAAPFAASFAAVSARAGMALLLAGALALAGCDKPKEAAPDVRPVRLMQLHPAAGQTAFEFSGEVRPRVESRLGFRVGGKIAARLVDVGASVRKGQPLARLDPTDLALAEQGSRAQYDAAKTDSDLAASDLKRYNELFQRGFISAAEQHRRQATYDAAVSRLQQAEAGLRNQANQTGYAVLTADADGVVTAIDAEVGQVVTPGQPVIRVAQTAEKEVAIGLPEDQVEMLRAVGDVTVHTWAEPDRRLPARVREISAAADPVTRTYPTRVSVPNPPADLRIGMTAVVTFLRTGETAAIRVPLTALLQDQGRNLVWIYEPVRTDGKADGKVPVESARGTVRPVQVTLGEAIGNDIVIRQGLAPGQTIVTAGVHLLKEGQAVKPMQSVSPSTPVAASGGGPK